MDSEIPELSELSRLKSELERLRAENTELKAENADLKSGQSAQTSDSSSPSSSTCSTPHLTLEEYIRYGRQLIIPEIGLKGQLRLKSSKVLVVGAGGLGCPALAYLAGAGVGTLGIADADTVDTSNLHRQILHSTNRVGILKSHSAYSFLHQLNPSISYKLHDVRLDSENAFGIISEYDFVLDCTDSPATRYLVSDMCVAAGKPLVSASGVRLEGQLSILNYPPGEGPCYRCFFPDPPPVNSVASCRDAGVLGPVIGTMGILMALEAVKLIIGHYEKEFEPFMLLFSAFETRMFRRVKMRGRRAACVTGNSEFVEKVKNGGIDYAEFCGRSTQTRLEPNDRISVAEYADIRSKNAGNYNLVDCRPSEQFDICALPEAIKFERETEKLQQFLPTWRSEPPLLVCRYGNDSQKAVAVLKQHGIAARDIAGGLNQWSKEIDSAFPRY